MAIRQWPLFLTRPIDPERTAAISRRRNDFPDEWQTGNQMIGRFAVACGATHGVYERCNFGCTACYLGINANKQKPMPFDEVRRQLEGLRAYLGPGGNVQITSGEVTLLPVEDLVRIVKTARALQLSPMVMTHGDTLLHDPDYLDRLVRDGGLRKLSIHVDTTQRGRRGFSRPGSEVELNEVRERMADALRACRRRLGVKLRAAATMTLNRENLPQLGDVVAWQLDHVDAFRILSLQPQAKTGRTRDDNGVTAEETWRELEQAVGMPLNPHPVHFGHPDCNRIALLFSIELGGGRRFILEGVRAGNAMDERFVAGFLRDFSGMWINDRPLSEVLLKTAGAVLRRPLWLWRALAYGVRRSWQERRHIPATLWSMARFKFRLRAFAYVVHAFMSEAELATEKGRERLDACAFKLSVDGRMVSMCEMNGTALRESTYAV